MAHRLEYRVIWGFKGDAYTMRKVSQQKSSALRTLIRVGTSTPWLGWTLGKLKRAWWMLAKQNGELPLDVIAGLSLRDAVLGIQGLRKPVDWIRVESRHVGQWTEVIDPLRVLKGPTTNKRFALKEELMDRIDAMTPEELAAWRVAPEER